MSGNKRTRRTNGAARPGGGRVTPPKARPHTRDPFGPPPGGRIEDRRAIAEAALADLWELGHTVAPLPRPDLLTRVSDHESRLVRDDRLEVQRLIEEWLTNELARCRKRHWEVGDLHHTVGRRLDPAHDLLLLRLLHRDLVEQYATRPSPANGRALADATAFLQEHGPVPDGRAGPVLEGLTRDSGAARAVVWVTALELLRLLFRTPELPALGPTTDDLLEHAGLLGGDGVDRKLLDRVRGLLAKAESTTFPDEADALTAKAQELMARHAIDQAMVGAHGTAAERGSGRPTNRRIWLDNPYLDGKSLLLTNVATANRCRAVYFQSLGFMTVVGYPADLDAIELLFTSLLVQSDTAIREAGSHTDRSGRSRTRSFRSSFWVAFASRIGARLEEAVAATVHQAEADHGARLLPVLASREDEVDAHVQELFPDAAPRGVVASNRAGWHAGTEAADRADIGVRKPIRS